MKNIGLKSIFGFVLVMLVMSSCSDPATHEIIVDVHMSQLIKNRVRNSKDEKFQKVYQASIKEHNKSNGDFIEIFFKKSDKLNPGRKYMKYFKTNNTLKINSSNSDVKAYFQTKREQISGRILESLGARLAMMDVSSCEFIEGKDQVRIGVTHPEDETHIARRISATTNFQFFETYDINRELAGVWNGACSSDESGTLRSKTRGYGNAFFVSKGDKSEVNRALDNKEVSSHFSKHIKFMWSYDQEEVEGQKGYFLYAIKVPQNGRARLDSYSIKSAESNHTEYDGKYAIDIKMTTKGAETWKQFTTANVGKCIAMTMDDLVFSAPMVNEPIIGGTTQISGNFTEQEAGQLARLIDAGNLTVFCTFNKLRKL